MGYLFIAGAAVSLIWGVMAALRMKSFSRLPRRTSTSFSRSVSCFLLTGNAARTRDGGWTAVFEVEMPRTIWDHDRVTDARASRLADLMGARFPEGTVFSFRREVFPSKGEMIAERRDKIEKGDPAAVLSILGLSYYEGLAGGGNFLDDRLFLHVRIPGGVSKGRGFRDLTKGLEALLSGNFRESAEAFDRSAVRRRRETEDEGRRKAEEFFARVVECCPLGLRRVEAGELFELLYRSHHPNATVVPRVETGGIVPLQPYLCSGSLHFMDWYAVLDGTPLCVVSMIVPPHQGGEDGPTIQADVTRELLSADLKFRFEAVTEFIVTDIEDAKAYLDKRINRVGFYSAASRRNAPETNTVNRGLKEVRAGLVKRRESLVRTRVFFLIHGKPFRTKDERNASLTDLAAAKNLILEKIRAMDGAEGSLETDSDLKVLLPTLLAGETDPEDETRDFIERCSSLTSLVFGERSWDGPPQPHSIFASSTDRLLGVNLLNAADTNSKFVLGIAGTGGGKSLLGARFISDLLTLPGAQCTICDFGSFRRFVRFLGGRFVSFTGKAAINVYRYPGLEVGAELSDLQIDLIVQDNINLLGAKFDTSEVRGILSMGVEILYQNPKANNRMNSSKIIPKFGDFLEVLKDLPLHGSLESLRQSLCVTLERYRGHSLIDADTSPDLLVPSRLTCFDLQSLKGLDPVVADAMAFRVASFVSRVMVEEGEGGIRSVKGFLFDEGEEIRTSFPGIFKAIEFCSRAGRKFSGVGMLLSQSYSDFAGLRGLVNNTGSVFIGTQNVAFDDLARDFALPPIVSDGIREIKNKPGFHSEFLFGQGAGVNRRFEKMRFHPDPFFLWLLTTDPSESNVVAELEHRRPHWSLFEVILYLSTTYPRGLRAAGLRESDVFWNAVPMNSASGERRAA